MKPISVGVIAPVLLAFALVGCTAAGAGTLASAPPPSIATTPPVATTPSGAEAPEPASRLGLDCAGLVDEALALAVLSAPVEAADPLVTASGVGIAIPRLTSILSEGGTVCEWSNGSPMNSQYGVEPGYAGVTVSVLPMPAAGWSAKATRNGMPSDATSCDSTDTCSMSRAVGDVWLTLEAKGGTVATIDPVAAEAMMSAVVATVTAAGEPSPLATPSRTAPPLPNDCEEILPLDIVREITADETAEPSAGAGGWSDWAEARLAAGNEGCRWSTGEQSAAHVGWIRDGRWAYERSSAAGTFSPTVVAGLAAGDTATLRCVAAGTSCAVDLAIGTDWLNVVGNDEATAVALAEAVVSQLTP